jgi:hypothetical protein
MDAMKVGQVRSISQVDGSDDEVEVKNAREQP